MARLQLDGTRKTAPATGTLTQDLAVDLDLVKVPTLARFDELIRSVRLQLMEQGIK